MYNKEVVNVNDLTIEPWYDPRTQQVNVFVIGYNKSTAKYCRYKLVEENYEVGVTSEPTFTMNGHESLPALLQKLVDVGYENYQLTPTKMKLESAAQTKHLNDMRAIVEVQLGVELK
jgi:hypothetical protein